MNMGQTKQIVVFLLRVVAGLPFLQAGGMKLFGWFGGMPGGQSPPLMSQVDIGGVLEFFGGIDDHAGPLYKAGRIRLIRRDGGRV